MRNKIVVVLCMILCLIGCGYNNSDTSGSSVAESKQVNSEKHSEDELQFIEVISAKGNSLGIMESDSSIHELISKEDIRSWKYCNKLPRGSKKLYLYKTYAVVKDPVMLNGSLPYINQSIDALYKCGKNYYLKNHGLDDAYIAKISDEAGAYLSKPQKLKLSKSRSSKTIIKEWKKEIQNLQDKPNELSAQDTEKSKNAETEKIQEVTGEGVRRTSSQQKIEILDAKNKTELYTTTDLEQITEFLKTFDTDKWSEITSIPKTSKIKYNVYKYALQRKTSKKKLVKMFRNEIFVNGSDYYCKEAILSNGENGDYITIFKIPKEVVNYIALLCSK